MKLHQGQVWKQGEEYLLIVEWSRMEIGYKVITDLVTRTGARQVTTKKEFCRLLKGAVLMDDEEVKLLSGRGK